QAWVVKADGLAAGKGVIVSESADEALAAVDRIMRHGAFGPAGTRVVLEERLEGEEISVHALVHGQSFQILGTAQDHKRLQDGDAGPNTGGMGAYTPPPVCDPALEARIERDIIAPILQEMCAAGRPLQGILFCGLMVQDAVPKVLEFNTRFGDPECQALLMRLESPLLPLLLSTAGRGKPLSEHTLCWRAPAALAVVLAAAGYPQSPVCGARINGLDQLATGNHLQVFHAGTRKRAAGDFETAGGRVLAVTASGDSVEAAANLAYRAVDTVHFDGKQWRRDIGWRALSCDRQKHVGPR
ncbi:MAG: phosphoribosylamine--glycine ligase, partial [Polyangiales bacterium]